MNESWTHRIMSEWTTSIILTLNILCPRSRVCLAWKNTLLFFLSPGVEGLQ